MEGDNHSSVDSSAAATASDALREQQQELEQVQSMFAAPRLTPQEVQAVHEQDAVDMEQAQAMFAAPQFAPQEVQAVQEQAANASDVLRDFVETLSAQVAENHALAFDCAQAWLAYRAEERSRELRVDPEERSRELRAESHRRYNESQQGHARQATYAATPGGAAAHRSAQATYAATPGGAAAHRSAQATYAATPEGIATQATYAATLGGGAAHRSAQVSQVSCTMFDTLKSYITPML